MTQRASLSSPELSADLTTSDGHKANEPLSRRSWLKRAIVGTTGLALGTGAYTRWIEPYWVEVVRRDLPIAGLPIGLHGKTLVQISDVHIGDRVSDSFLIHWFKQIAEWKPDIVAFTGDFLTLNRDGSLPCEKMQNVLKHFPLGRLATVGILGNHDYGMRWSERQAAEQVTTIATDSGLAILRNESFELEGLQILGLDDYWSPNFYGARFLRQSELNGPTVVLCHNPDVATLPIWCGYRGWILSGHTHGGQCKAPFLRPPLLPIRNRQLYAGEFCFPEGHRLYVNRALGHSIPVSFKVRPEITLFRLVEETPA